MRHSFALVLVLVVSVVYGFCGQAEGNEPAVIEKVSAEELFTKEEMAEFRNKWMNEGNLDERINRRREIAEKIGEEAAERWAKQKNWEKILGKDGKTPSHVQGYDQVWRKPDGKICVIEAKGGESPLGTGYGQKQGTIEWAQKAGEETLKSRTASFAERRAAEIVQREIPKGNVEVQVVRTTHVQGQPQTVTVHAPSCSQTLKAVQKAVTGASCQIPSKESKAAAETAKNALKHTRFSQVGKVAGIAGTVVDAGVRVYESYEIEKQYQNGELTRHERNKGHVKNAAGGVAGLSGAAAGGYSGALAGAAIGSFIPGPGTAIGGFIGGTIGAVGGYFGGEKAAESAVDACM